MMSIHVEQGKPIFVYRSPFQNRMKSKPARIKLGRHKKKRYGKATNFQWPTRRPVARWRRRRRPKKKRKRKTETKNKRRPISDEMAAPSTVKKANPGGHYAVDRGTPLRGRFSQSHRPQHQPRNSSQSPPPPSPVRPQINDATTDVDVEKSVVKSATEIGNVRHHISAAHYAGQPSSKQKRKKKKKKEKPAAVYLR